MLTDDFFMHRALEVGEKARLLSPPNPWVGCVLVKNQMIIGEGHTQAPGEDHAEVQALQAAAANGEAAGATAYVSLEPCAHYGKTPPCTKALIQARVKRVVIALEDPDPNVQGRGIAELTQAGIEVTTKVCSDKAEISLRSYLHHRKTGKAYCIVKAASSLDGKSAAADGTSQWITCRDARLDVHRLRAESQAVMVGSGTALKDLPALTVREVDQPRKPPLRILLDRRGRVPILGPLFDLTEAPTLVISSTEAPQSSKDQWLAAKLDTYFLQSHSKFEDLLIYLGGRGILQLLVEGGPTLQSSIIDQKQCQELVFYIGSLLIGEKGRPCFQGPHLSSLAEAVPLKLLDVIEIGQSARLRYQLATAALDAS